MKVSWQVTGTRHDPYAEKYPIQVEQIKPAGERGLLSAPISTVNPTASALALSRNLSSPKRVSNLCPAASSVSRQLSATSA